MTFEKVKYGFELEGLPTITTRQEIPLITDRFSALQQMDELIK